MKFLFQARGLERLTLDRPTLSRNSGISYSENLMTCECPPWFGAGRGNRTPMMSPSRDFESRASTNSAIPAKA